jgi:spermidine synthase
MSYTLQNRPDGSIALFIDGDLQFDSCDEHIYHECLVTPALLLATSRIRQPLSVLIIGGGDGLAARELLKYSSIAEIDLVDRDPQIVDLAQSHAALLELNRCSLADERLTITICDARDFVRDRQNRYHIIISDLTVPKTESDTQLHSIEWYSQLKSILAPNGSMAVNVRLHAELRELSGPSSTV